MTKTSNRKLEPMRVEELIRFLQEYSSESIVVVDYFEDPELDVIEVYQSRGIVHLVVE